MIKGDPDGGYVLLISSPLAGILISAAMAHCGALSKTGSPLVTLKAWLSPGMRVGKIGHVHEVVYTASGVNMEPGLAPARDRHNIAYADGVVCAEGERVRRGFNKMGLPPCRCAARISASASALVASTSASAACIGAQEESGYAMWKMAIGLASESMEDGFQ